MRHSAYYYDGRSSEQHVVSVDLSQHGYLVLTGFSVVHRFSVEQVELQPRIGNQPAVVDLPDGARVEIDDADGFYEDWQRSTGRTQWQHLLESRGSLILGVLVATVFVGWLIYDRGIPAVADRAAALVPYEVDQRLGRDGLQLLDEQVFRPSRLGEERQDELRSAMLDVIAEVGGDSTYELVFRDGAQIGPNAFALPAGIVVLTDQLVELSDNDAELQAIMAHEVGHVRSRHPVRNLLQRSFVTGLLIVVTGDIAAAGGLVVTLPTMVLQAGYSREFEYEADRTARDYLLQTGQPLTVYTDILERLEQVSPGMTPAMLRTHPETPERIEAFLD